LRTAVKMNKQLYVFIERSVDGAYRHYRKNKNVAGVTYENCDDVRILKFIEEVEALPRNNQIILFDTADQISDHLREQWSGLFQRFLQEQEALPDRRVAEEMQSTLKTLNELVVYLTAASKDQNAAVQQILLSSHPIFQRLRKLTHTPYRVFFLDRQEMENWLKVKGYKAVPEFEWEDAEVSEFLKIGEEDDKRFLLQIRLDVFDSAGRLRANTVEGWQDAWVQVVELKTPIAETKLDDFEDFRGTLAIDDDDLPF